MGYIFNKRTFFLLIILMIVGFFGFQHFSKQIITTNWNQPLIVTIFPLNDGGDPTIQPFINSVTPQQFQQSVDYLQEQSIKYGITAKPIIKIEMGNKLKNQDIPLPPKGNNMLNNLVWSLKLRWWAYEHAFSNNDENHINVFILYRKLKIGGRLPHSQAVKMGYTAIVYAFADNSKIPRNNVVFTHELLHTVGAADRYNDKLQPIYPDGYAFPNSEPLYPQDKAEIMAPFIAINKNKAEPAQNLNDTIVGPETANEIGWW